MSKSFLNYGMVFMDVIITMFDRGIKNLIFAFLILIYCGNCAAYNLSIDNELINEGEVSRIVKWINEEKNKSYIINSSGATLLHHISKYPLSRAQPVIEALLNNGLNIDVRDGKGASPIMHAIQYKRVDIVEYLLTKGSNVESTDDHGNSLLVYVCNGRNKNQDELLEKLVNAGVNVNLHNVRGDNCLTLSIKRGDTALLDKLLTLGANPNKQKALVDPALHVAVNKGSLLFIDKLLQAGADIEKKNSRGQTPLLVSLSKMNYQVVEKLVINGADVNFATERTSVAEYVLKTKNRSLIKLMIKSGLKVNSKTNVYPELYSAVKKGDIETVDYYLQFGVSPNHANKYKNSLLIIATDVKNINISMLKLLIRYGADINEKNDHQSRKPLINIIRTANIEALELLIDAGADLSLEGRFNTPLSTAITSKKYVIAKLLIERGAKVEQRNSKDKQALNYIVANFDNSKEMSSLLKAVLDRNVVLNNINRWDSLTISKIRKSGFDRQTVTRLYALVSVSRSATGKISHPKSRNLNRVNSKAIQNSTIDLRLSEKAELHVIGIYEGDLGHKSKAGFRSREQATVKVNIPYIKNPVVLVLSSYEPVHWFFQIDAFTRIERVVLSGYHDQSISGLSKVVPVTDLQRHAQSTINLPYAYKKKSRKYEQMEKVLFSLTGKKIDAFYGDYKGSEFTLSNSKLANRNNKIYKWTDENGKVHFGDKKY